LRVGKIVMITVPLPLVLLVLLALRGLTLPGAMNGLAYYLTPDWSALLDANTWVEAYGQVFFSLSVGWGILIAYSSYVSRKADVVNNAYITSFANCGFSYLAGFAVFSTLGFLAVSLKEPIADQAATSFGLAFTSYPTAVENFPGGTGFQAVIAVGFFLMLLTLGVDSAFSIVEAVATAMYDKFRIKRTTLTRLLCVTGFVMGLVFCFGSGLFWLDTTDKFLNDYGLALVALVQCVLVAWVIPRSKFRELKEDLNARSEVRAGRMWEISLRWITPIVLGTAIVLNTHNLIVDGYEDYPTWGLLVGGAAPAALVLIAAFLLMNMRGRGDAD
ncbi:MAG: sodium-dependent transporter, partial [Planctomycetota bacterium]